MRQLILVFFTIYANVAFSQTIDYNNIILPSSATELEMEEKLVRLAWNNAPQTKIWNHQLAMQNYEINQSRWSWLDNIKVQGNLNEFNLDPSSDPGNRSEFFPRYNISALFSLGDFVLTPMETKRRKEELEIAKENINAGKLALRAEVLTRYQNYLYQREMLNIQNESLEDTYASYLLVEQSFKNGETTIREYNTSLANYNRVRANKLQAENAYEISKIRIEELIGMKLEDVE